MQLALIANVFLAVIALAYHMYGSWIARMMGIDAKGHDGTPMIR